MISKSLEQAFNEQVREEMSSFYIYLAMAAYFEANHFGGMAKWMQAQAKEEMAHAMKFYGQIMERGGTVVLQALPQPPKEWASPAAAFTTALDHERHISKCIHTLMEKATAEKDFAASGFLQWFVNEQVEEEAHVEPIVHRLGLIKDNLGALFMLDRELGMRQ